MLGKKNSVIYITGESLSALAQDAMWDMVAALGTLTGDDTPLLCTFYFMCEKVPREI